MENHLLSQALLMPCGGRPGRWSPPPARLAADQRFRLNIGRVNGKREGIGSFIYGVDDNREGISLPKGRVVSLQGLNDVVVVVVANCRDVDEVIVIG